MNKHPVITALAALSGMLGIAGCSSLGDTFSGTGHTITVRSEPPQASVLADGTEIGSTPLTFSPSDAFRSGITSRGEAILAYSFIGKLTVRKPGCKDYVTEVDDNILSKDIDVKLDCDPDYRPPAAPQATVAPAVPPVAAPAAQPPLPASAEQRLQRIESLHEKGLITDGEYRQLRQRVLDTL